MKLEIVNSPVCQLGESPVWHQGRKSCLWVDIEGCKIYEYSWARKDLTVHQLDRRVSLVIPGKNDELILGLQGGIGRYGLDTKALSIVTDLGTSWENQRCNDGISDSKGRLWIGLMSMENVKETGSVYSIDTNKDFKVQIPQVSISNGMAWSLDNKRLYYIDSMTGQISSFLYDETSGDIIFEKAAISIPKNMGLPDGMAMDEEGMLWVALWGGFGVARFNIHTSKMVDFIKVPAPHVSSCAFAGEGLDYLIITTAREGMTKEDIVNYPKSGQVFIADPGVKGKSKFHCML